MSELVRVTRGVWRPADVVADLLGRAAAVLAVAPDRTVIGGLTAARLHGLWLPDLPEGPIEVIVHRDRLVPAHRPGSRRREVRARRQRLPDDEITHINGVPVTSESRTWLDLAPRLGLADLIAAGDSALRGAATIDELGRLIDRAVHTRGVVRARAALPLLDTRSRSRPESHLRYILVRPDLPTPEVNEPIYSADGEWLAEPDLSYDDVRLALEYNGADHARPKRMRRDITREVDVTLRGGWRTITFGPTEVFARPDQIVAVVRQVRRELRQGQ
jgi:hypothetical protein